MLKYLFVLFAIMSSTNMAHAEQFDLQKELHRRTAIQKEIGILEKVIKWQEEVIEATKVQNDRDIEVINFKLPKEICQRESFAPICDTTGEKK